MIILSLAVLTLGSARQAESAVPFVAAFERFGRHDDISKAQAGRVLIAELSCSACHVAGPEVKPKKGPDLDGVGNRVSREWIGRLLDDPQKVKLGTTMPAVLAGLSNDEKQKAKLALIAFLGSLQKPFPEIRGTGARPVPHEFWKRGDLARGRQLYHRIGCVACHEADESYETVETKPTPLDQLLEELDAEELKELGLSSAARRVEPVPHGDLTAKYSRQSLTFFLMDPHIVRPGGRMPNFQLTVGEASDLTAWLLRDQKTVPLRFSQNDAKPDAKLVADGRRLFRSLGCANCHSAAGLTPIGSAKELAQLNFNAARSCTGKSAQGLPHFPLDEKQLSAIKAGREGTDRIAFARSVNLPGVVQFHLLKQNCFACHERDKLGGIGRYRKAFFETYGHVDIGDEGRLPPPLTNVGSKLQPAWMTKVLQGTGRVRPHMRIRMPVFPLAEVGTLPALFSQTDFGQNKKQPTEKTVFGGQANLAEAGRQLLDTGCVQCHPLRTEALPGVIGVDLAGIATRVQPKWFHDFLINPAALKPRTRMPTFFPNGKSQNATILEGHTERQVAAMWAYLKDLNRQKLPPKIEKARSQNYELVPKGRPILLRTFMEEAGTHAIAVGFPAKVHFAFDAEQIRPAFSWRGRFLDARGTWFERFTPPAVPLGGGVALPVGVAFALPDKPSSPWPSAFDSEDHRYHGHRLDKAGIPIFRYSVGDFSIEDRLTPLKESGLKRELTISLPEGTRGRAIRFLAQTGSKLNHRDQSCTNAAGLKVTVMSRDKHRGHIVKIDGHSELRLSVHVEGTTKLEVHYQW